MAIHNFKANCVSKKKKKNSLYQRKGRKILSYYVVGNAPLEMQFSVNSATVLDLELLESSFDLLTNPLFQITKRENWMMPTPFVLNDAVVIRQKIKPSPVVVANTLNPAVVNPVVKERVAIVKDSLKVE